MRTRNTLTHEDTSAAIFTSHMHKVGKAVVGLLLASLCQSRANGQVVYVNAGASTNGIGTAASPYNNMGSIPNLGTDAEVYFMPGHRYSGRMNIAQGSQNILITRWPGQSGPDPVICGSYPVEFGSPIVDADPQLGNWQHLGSGRWRIKLSTDSLPKYLYEDTVLKPMARYPNEGSWARNDIYRRNGNVSTLYPTTEFPLPQGDLTGAELVIRSSNFYFDVRNVTGMVTEALDPDVTGSPQVEKITFARLTPNPAGAVGRYRWGFFLRGLEQFLDATGEWWYDAAGKWLHYQSGNTTNAPANVRLAIHRHAVLALPSVLDVTITGVEFQHQSEAAIRMRGNARRWNVHHCEFSHLRIGILDLGGPNNSFAHRFESNRFHNTYDPAIVTYGGQLTEGGQTTPTIIADNLLSEIAMVPGLGNGNGLGYQGIISYGIGYEVRGNRLLNIGYGGIELHGTGIVENNSIVNALKLFTDGGGIQMDYANGITLRNNIVAELEHPESLVSAAPDYFAYATLGYGIYYGNHFVRNTVVEGNVVTGATKGIYVDHTKYSENASIRSNTLFGNQVQLVMTDLSNSIEDGLVNELEQPVTCPGPPGTNGPYVPSYTDEYEGNILYCTKPEQRCMEQNHVFPDTHAQLVDFGDFQDNYYYDPFSRVTHYQTVRYSVPGGANSLTAYIDTEDRKLPWTLEAWRSVGAPGQDAGSATHPLHVPPFRVLSEPAPEAVAFHSDNCSTPNAWSGSPQQLTGDGADGGYLRFATTDYVERWAAGLGSLTPIQSGSATPPGVYRVTTVMRSPETDVIQLGPVWRTNLNKYARPFDDIVLSTGWSPHECFLDLTAPQSSSTFVLAMQNVQLGYGARSVSTIDVDDVKVERVAIDEVYLQEIAANHRLFYHCPLPGTEADNRNVKQYGGTLTIPGSPGQCWSDVYGNFYAAGDQITLDEWASIVLFRMDPSYDIDVAIYDVQGSETWTTNMKVRGSIVIESGETLTIDGATIEFADSRQGDQVLTNIVVQPGGMLNLINGAHLTTLQGCGNKSMWDGVKVLGNTDGTAFGDATIQDQSRISNALIGIFCGDGDLLNPGRTGPVLPGRVFLWGGIFENNRYDVVRHGRPDGSPGSGVNNQHMHVMGNTFITSAPLNYKGSSGFEDFDPVAHLMLSDHHYVFLADNTFANDIGAHTHSHRMGHGIDALNTNLRFWEPNAFRNLDHAIHSANTVTSIPQFSSVTGCSFTDNICAVYFNGLTTFSVADNTIEMGRWADVELTYADQVYWAGMHRGIYTSSANGFSIQGNMLGLSAGAAAGALTEGIVVGYTQEADEIVYANTATGLERGFVGEGICADADAPWATGLQFQCNTNSGNATNFMGRKAQGDSENEDLHTIRARQGSDLLAVGNTLDQANSTQFYLNTENTAALVVSYFYEDAGAQVLNPALVTNAGLQEVQGVAMGTGAINACDSPGPGVVGGPITLEELPSAVADNREAYRSLRYLHGQLLDGGDTEAIIANVDSICSIAELLEEYQEIGGEISPFLSIYALQSVIACENLSYEQRASVLIANPEPTQNGNLLGFMIDAGFPEYLIDAVKASWSTRTYRAELEMRMADRHTDMMQAAYHWINLLHQDSVPPQPEAIRHVWQQVDAPHARFAEAALFAGEGQYPQAKRVMELAAEEYIDQRLVMAEVVRMQDYLHVLAHADSLGRSPYELDSAEVALLQLLVDERYDRVGNWASNLLCAIYGICRAPFTGGGDDAPKARHVVDEPQTHASKLKAIRLQPNPASDLVHVLYCLPGNTSMAKLSVRDFQGRVLQEFRIHSKHGQVQFHVSRMAPGAYMVTLISGDQIIGSEKLIIKR